CGNAREAGKGRDARGDAGAGRTGRAADGLRRVGAVARTGPACARRGTPTRRALRAPGGRADGAGAADGGGDKEPLNDTPRPPDGERERSGHGPRRTVATPIR